MNPNAAKAEDAVRRSRPGGEIRGGAAAAGEDPRRRSPGARRLAPQQQTAKRK